MIPARHITLANFQTFEQRSTLMAAARRPQFPVGMLTFWAMLSVISLLMVASVNEDWTLVWMAVLAFAWSFYNPYCFVALLFPALIPFSLAQTVPGVEVSFLRVAVIIAVLGCFLKPAGGLAGLRAVPWYLWLSFAILLLAYSLSYAANGFPSEGPFRFQVCLMRMLQLLLMFVSVHYLKDGRLLLIGLVIAGCAVLGAGIYAWRETGDMLVSRSTFMPLGSPLGVAVLIAKSGTFAVVSGVAAFALAALTKKRVSRIILYHLGVFIFFASLFSGRREALVAMFLAFASNLFIQQNRHKYVIVLLMLLATLILYQAGPLQSFLEQRESFADEFSEEGTHRLPLLVRSIELWLESPAFGYGPGTHERILWTQSTLNDSAVAAHNSITGAMVEAGVLGGLAVLTLLLGFVTYWVRAIRAARRCQSAGWPPLMLASAATIITLAGVGDFINQSGSMLIIGMLSAWWVKSIRAEKEAAPAPSVGH